MIRRFVTTLAALLVVALLSAPAPARQAPGQVVEKYHTILLAVMKNADELGFQGRFEALKPVINESFNLPFMARMTVGRYWDKMTDEQRKRLIEAFSDFSVANFAYRFDSYSGQRFETVRDMETRRNDILIFTEIVKPNGDKVRINYLLRGEGNDWRIIDIYLDNSISELATRRSEYVSVIRRNGIEELIDAIKSKTRELATR